MRIRALNIPEKKIKRKGKQHQAFADCVEALYFLLENVLL